MLNDGDGPSGVTERCIPCDALQIAVEGDVLNAHCSHARGRTDDERTATCAGTVREKMPERMVHRELIHAEHALHTGHSGTLSTTADSRPNTKTMMDCWWIVAVNQRER